MKRLAPEGFLRQFRTHNQDESNFAYTVKVMQSYADHCEETEWIRVDECLPDNTQSVLVFANDDILSIGWYSPRIGKWFLADDGYIQVELIGVTHFRSLPKPPKS